MSRVDRRKHDWDVMEHVFGGVQAEHPEPRSHVVSMALQPWIGGLTTSVVQVTVNAMPEQQQPPEQRTDRHQEHDRHHESESDRRGEHKYPHQDDRPSQRERDDLKERLERGR